MSPNLKLIIWLCFATSSYGQSSIIKDLRSAQDADSTLFCSYDLILFKDSTCIITETDDAYGLNDAYFCTSWGKWKPKGKYLDVVPTTKSWIKNIRLSKHDTGDTTVFVVKDCKGYSMPRFHFCGIQKDEKYQLTRFKQPFKFPESIYHKENDSNEYVPRYLYTDSKGNNVVPHVLWDWEDSEKINCAEYDSIVLTKLDLASGEHYAFSTKNLPDTVYMQINIINEILFYTDIHPVPGGRYLRYPIRPRTPDEDLNPYVFHKDLDFIIIIEGMEEEKNKE